MRKTTALLLSILIVISLVACASDKGADSSLPAAADASSASAPSSSLPSSSDATSSVSSEPSAPPTSSEAVSSQPDTPTEPTPPPEPLIKPLEQKQYFGYTKLTAEQKAAYDILAAEVDSMPNRYICLGPASVISERDAHHIAVTLKHDRPDIFWLPYSWSIGELPDGDMAILFINEHGEEDEDIESLTATYIVERAKKAAMQTELRERVEEIKARVTATDPYEIELQLHDILCELISYSSSPDALSYTAYGALVRGEAVCEGYSRAMQLLLYEFGIRSTPVVGFTHEPHMWNLVELNGKWYHLDLTFDDNILGTRHDYFNLTDPAISLTRIIEPSPDDFTDMELFEGKPYNYMLPVCNSTEHNYFMKTGYTYLGNTDELIALLTATDAPTLEMMGWCDELREPVLAALAAAGFEKASVQTDGEWAKIFKTTESPEEQPGGNTL